MLVKSDKMKVFPATQYNQIYRQRTPQKAQFLKPIPVYLILKDDVVSFQGM